MSGSAIAKRQRRSHARSHGDNDVNVVPMLDIFTILLFFLIFTAVLTPTRIIELNLPGLSSQPALDLPKDLVLEVVVRKDSIVVQDKNAGPLEGGVIPNTSAGYDYAALNLKMAQIKRQKPEHKSATILLEPLISYEIIVSTMDAVRAVAPQGGVAGGELFPEISFGDAP